MTINDIISLLKNKDSKESAYLTLEIKNLIENRKQAGSLFNKNFKCDVKVIWASAKLEVEMQVSTLINLLNKKEISGMTHHDFSNCSVVKTSEGNTSLSHVVWESELNHKDAVELIDHDLASESDIMETLIEIAPGSVTSLTIECDGLKETIK